MKLPTRVFPCLSVLVLAVASAGPGLGQNSPTKKHALTDFDVRELAAARAPAGVEQSRAKATLDLRRANLGSFLARESAARPGLRIVPNQYGLPKVLRRDGGTLSAPSTLAPEDAARNYLRANHQMFPFAPAELDNLRLIVKDVTAEATFLAFNQTLDGIDVFNGQIKVTLTKAGEVVQVAAADVVPELNVATKPRLSHEEAALSALRLTGSKAPAAALSRSADPNGKVAFRNPHGARYSPITSELTIFPVSATSARLAYRIFVDTDAQTWYEVVVDAETGAMLFRHNLYTQVGQANVWKESPLVGSRQMVTFPDGWLPAAPNGSGGVGWVTTGNNADAYLDTNGDDKPDSTSATGLQGGRAYAASAVFDFPFGDGTLNLNPRNFQAAAVTNLFYFVNAAHDYYYALGFDEAAGNFQTDNFGRGGKGGDAVLAEAQQGNATDNAAFAPTAEGTAPKLRVGLWTFGTSSLLDDLDFDYAGQVLVHEYGHGVSNRLVGSKTSTSCLMKTQSGAMGEGWSDYFAISYTNNPVLGAYGGSNTAGIRRQSYEGYTFTYEDIGNGDYGYEVHDDGEIWTATLWDLRKSLGQAVTDRLVMDGLKSTPCSPSMTDARDAILSADQAANGGANRATIWQVFARHGLGYSAAGIDGTILAGNEYDAAYDQPPDLQGMPNPAITSQPLAISASVGSAYSYTVAATNPNLGTLNFDLTSGPAGMTIDAGSGLVTWTSTFIDQRVKITVTDGVGGRVVHGYELPVFTTLGMGNSVMIGGPKNSDGFAGFTVPAGTTAVLQVTLRGGSGDADLYVIDPSGYYQYSIRTNTNSETLSYALPEAGAWILMVDGYAAYSGVSLTASLVTPTPVSPNATLSNLSGALGSESLYRVTLPAGQSSFKVSTSGGTGDVDLYLKLGKVALCQSSLSVSQACYYDSHSGTSGNSDSITIGNPAAGDWYLDLSGYAAYSGVTLTTVLAPPLALAVSPSALSFHAAVGVDPPAQSLAITSPGGVGLTWTATAASTGNWLKISPSISGTNSTLQVSVVVGSMAAGTYSGTVTITPANSTTPVTINAGLTVSVVPTPVLTAMKNAASWTGSAVSPGENIVIGGAGIGPTPLAPLTQLTSAGKVPTTLGDTQVLFDGIAAPMIYASAAQTSAMVPYGVGGHSTTSVQVSYLGVKSAAVSFNVTQAVPGIYTQNSQGFGPGSILNQDGVTLNTSAAPAPVGSIVSIYMTGEGATSPAGADGSVANTTGNPLTKPILAVTATVAGRPATVNYYGSAPGNVYGVMQVNVTIPAGTSSGAQPLSISVGNNATPAGVTVAVK